MNCLLCEQVLMEGNRDESGSPSSGFLRFYTRGGRSSSIFDPGESQADYQHLQVGICDDCLRRAGERGLVLHEQLETMPGYPLPGHWNHTNWRYLPEVPGTIIPLQQFPHAVIL